MPYQPPSAEEISRALRAAVRAELPQSDPFLWPNNLGIVSKVIAQGLRGAYLRLAWVLRQAFASTADPDFLAVHGDQIGLSLLPGTYASGSLSTTTVVGAFLPAGTRFLRADGLVLISLSDLTAPAATSLIAVRALDAGSAGNTSAGATIKIETPVAGIGAATVADGGLTGGTDGENDASFRARILFAKRNPPHGGSPAEYIGWSRSMPGVTRVYVRRATPVPGSVTVLFMMDDTYGDGVPAPADATILAGKLAELAPSNAAIVVQRPTPVPVNVTVASLNPNTTAVRDAITLELKAMFRRRAEPGLDGASFTFSKSWIAEAVSIATGERSHRLTAPADDVVCTAGQIAVLGTVTFA